MKLLDMTCPHCGAPLSGVEHTKLTCDYCGSVLLIDGETRRRMAPAEEPTEIRRTAAAAPVEPVKKHRTWLWVLGWIFIYPVPLTILIARSKKLPKAAKIILIALAWLTYLALCRGQA